jgi:CHRD domain/NHL repeat
MKHSLFASALAAAMLVAAPLADAALIHLSVNLIGSNEVPANGSLATGVARLDLDTTAQTLTGHIVFSGLTGNTTMAHVHCCLASSFLTGVNVGVATVVPAFPNFPLGVTSGTDDFVLDLSSASAYNPAFVTAQGGLANAKTALIAGLLAGETYLNIHTTTFPGGEIRGFVTPSVSNAVDPYWMRPLPNFWVTGEVSGTCAAAQDHIFMVTRGFQTGGLASPEGVGGANITGVIGSINQSKAAPPVIEFDQNGYLFNTWGNPALVPTGQPFAGQNAVLPNGLHGCFVDFQGNVWIAGTSDGVVQKYSHDGSTKLLTIGTKFSCDDGLGGSINCTGAGGGNVGRTGVSHTLLNLPADVAVDSGNGEVYIADGNGNHRVVVFDAAGNYLRQMGGVGTGAGQFAAGVAGQAQGHPSCVVLPNNGLVYACDRGNDRINVFTKGSGTTPGTFVTAIPVIPGTAALGTLGSGSDISFSPDSAQTFMYVADGANERTWIMNHAAALAGTAGAILGSFGNGFGHDTGEFTVLDTITVDSKGNAYTAETTGGRRLQRFVVTPPN